MRFFTLCHHSWTEEGQGLSFTKLCLLIWGSKLRTSGDISLAKRTVSQAYPRQQGRVLEKPLQ